MSKRFNRYSIIAPALALVALIVLIVLTTEPAAASDGILLQQDEGTKTANAGFLCTNEGNPTFFGRIITNLLSFLFVSGIPVFIVLYQLDGILEFFALGAETKSKIKKHQRNLWMGAAKIYLIPVFGKLLFIDVLGVIGESCITLVPF